MDPADRSSPFPAVVILMDNYGAFHAAFEDNAGYPLRDLLARTIADGPGLGVVAAVAVDRPTGVPGTVGSVIPNKVAFRLGEPGDYGFFGLSSREVGRLAAGRAVDAATKLELHVALPHPQGLAAAVAEVVADLGPVDATRRPPAVGTLPDDVGVDEVAGALSIDEMEWFLPVGIGDTTLAPVGLRLLEAEHAFISGPARSGKSTVLDALAAVIHARCPEVVITAVALRRSPLRHTPGVARLVTSAEELAPTLGQVLDDPAAQLVLVDDAEGVDDTAGALAALISKGRANLHVVAAARPDSLRSNYIHWTVPLRASRQGLALKPNVDQDGNLWNLYLPRGGPATFPPGRGYLIAEGQAELVQGAHR